MTASRLLTIATVTLGILIAIVVIAGAIVTISDKHDLNFGQYIEDLTILGSAIAVGIGGAAALFLGRQP